MRRAFRLSLALAAFCCLAAGTPADDLGSIETVMRKQDPSLATFRIEGRKAVKAWEAVLLVSASAKAAPRSPLRPVAGVLLVSIPDNRVRLVIDIYRPKTSEPFPTLVAASAHAAYLDFYSDYGLYFGSIKYFFDDAHRTPPVRQRYRKLALVASAMSKGRIVYDVMGGVDEPARKAVIDDGLTYRKLSLEPRDAGQAPAFRLAESPRFPFPPPGPDRTPIRTPDGASFLVVNKTPPGQTHQPSGIEVTEPNGKKRFYPSPVATVGVFGTQKPQNMHGGIIEIDIGPWAADASHIWFANTFYDAEGVSGAGAIGSFDFASRKYAMRYLPVIAPWSASAILLDRGALWIGLMRRPEGSAIGGGLLRFDLRDGSTRRYPFSEYVYTIDRVEETIYCGTSDGLYTLHAEALRHFSFEPDVSGHLSLVMRMRRQMP